MGSPEAELSVVVTDDAGITELNRNYLQREGPTNVIAFPMQEGEFSDVSPFLLGDVVISADTARQEAEDAGIDEWDRIIQLLVHGILHLFGYDHENDPEEEARMNAKASAILQKLDIPPDPDPAAEVEDEVKDEDAQSRK